MVSFIIDKKRKSFNSFCFIKLQKLLKFCLIFLSNILLSKIIKIKDSKSFLNFSSFSFISIVKSESISLLFISSK